MKLLKYKQRTLPSFQTLVRTFISAPSSHLATPARLVTAELNPHLPASHRVVLLVPCLTSDTPPREHHHERLSIFEYRPQTKYMYGNNSGAIFWLHPQQQSSLNEPLLSPRSPALFLFAPVRSLS